LAVSSKTITRMVNDGKLPRLQGMRNIRIPRDGLEQWVTDNTVYNPNRARPEMRNPQGERQCISARRKKVSTNATGVLSGTHLTKMQAVRELDAVLKLRTRR
jgi:excisionase family DNA binding protein